MIEIKNLKKSFRKKQVIDDFSCSFEHKVYGLLGPNGAGKTTLMRCITGLYNIDAGDIKINGLNIKKSKTNIGYLPQKFGMFKELTVLESLLFFANIKDIKKKEALEDIKNVLELVNLSERLNSKCGSLSGGMLRRLGIAQAILGNAEIIIFDEPTAGLDPEERLRFKTVISKIKNNKTIIISTHIVDDVESICDNVIVMNNGKIAATGTCEEIKKLADDKVYVLPLQEENKLLGNYNIEEQFEKDGKIMIRIISKEEQAFQKVSPTLEDGYICALKEI